jgi:hypothetical protein
MYMRRILSVLDAAITTLPDQARLAVALECLARESKIVVHPVYSRSVVPLSTVSFSRGFPSLFKV